MDNNGIKQYINDLPSDVAQRLSFSHRAFVDDERYWAGRKDEDGFTISIPGGIKKQSRIYKYLQEECWKKFCDNPQVRTSIMDTMGRLAGFGFGVHSEVQEIQDTIDLLTEDPRNRLHTFLPKYLARAEIEGELFLVFTVHSDGFVEIDFRDPGTVGGPYTDSGILTLRSKPTMPVVYCFEDAVDMDGNRVPREQIPSIYVARYPELLDQLVQENDGKRQSLDMKLVNKNRNTSIPAYKPFNGYYRFVVQWDKGFMTKRNLSHLRTVIKWVNLYESLKMYEIDHKRSSGAYLWTFSFQDITAYKIWASMSEEERKKTGIMQKKTPGGTIILPPGMEMQATNPNLPKISDADSDIINMVGSGLNTTSSMMMGTEDSTYAAAKASSGPISDRIKDSISWWERFLRYDLWDNLFFIREQMGLLQSEHPVTRCIGFKKKKPQFKEVKVPTRRLIDFSFPYSDLGNLENLTKAYLGVKHGSMADVLGIPRDEIVRRLGFGNYAKLRQQHAVEEETYTELLRVDDPNAGNQESQQEKANNKTSSAK